MQTVTRLSEQLEQYLSLAGRQLELTAGNMANIDTPGYRSRGIDFAAEMRRSIEEFERGNQAPQKSSPRVFEVDGLLERPDGNNVSMDRESLNLAETQLEFRTGIELLKHEYRRISTAIHEDAR